MKTHFPILVEYVAACLATALALSTAIAFKHSHGLTDFIAIATSLVSVAKCPVFAGTYQLCR